MNESIIILGDIVHRLSNQLGIVRLDLQYIRTEHENFIASNKELDEVLLEMTEKVYESLEFLDALGNTFVDSNRFEALNLWELIEKALERSKIPSNIKVIKDKSENLPKAIGTDRLISVFENLISNAIEAMPTGGTLSINAKVNHENNKANLTITDTGNGIPLDLQKKIFNMIVSTKKHKQGLGLWWSKLYLQQIDGDISFLSKVDEGTNFVVSLQLAQ